MTTTRPCWVNRTLGEVCKFQGGTQPPRSTFRFAPEAGCVRLLQIRDFETDQHQTYVSREHNLRFVDADDVLLARYGASVGKILRGKSGAINVALMRAMPDESVLSKSFLYYFLHTLRVRNYLVGLGGRSAQAGFNQGELNRIEIPIPCRVEQSAIVSILDVAKSQIKLSLDELALERERKAALMEYIFTRGTRGEPTKQSEIGEIPESWTVAPLGSVANLVSGGTPSRENVEWWKGAIPWASPKDMKRVRLADTQEHVTKEAIEAGSRLVPPRTIFIVIRGMILAKDVPVGLTEVPMAFNQDMKAVLPHAGYHPEFLLYALIWRKDGLAKHIGTSAHGTRRLGTAAVHSLELPIPPVDEQIEVSQILESCERKIAALVREIPLHAELFKAILEELMSGRVSAPQLIEEQLPR